MSFSGTHVEKSFIVFNFNFIATLFLHPESQHKYIPQVKSQGCLLLSAVEFHWPGKPQLDCPTV